MKEYFKCKRCYSEIGMHKIARHHLKVHPDVPMEQYVDYFFDLNRPLLKCEFCRCKLSEKQLTKHLQRAHLTKYREQQRKLLISTKHILGTKLRIISLYYLLLFINFIFFSLLFSSRYKITDNLCWFKRFRRGRPHQRTYSRQKYSM